MEVHRELGCGFLEPVYQEAMEIELGDRGIPFRSQCELPVHYKGRKLKAGYRPDLVCFDSILIELKALSRLSGAEDAQVINYLKAGGYRLGHLLNFGSRSLVHRRFVRSESAQSA